MIRTLEDYQAAVATLEQIKDGLDGSSRRTAEFLSRQIEAWDTAYGAGYAAGKEKAFFEIRMRLAADPHVRQCGCEPCKALALAE